MVKLFDITNSKHSTLIQVNAQFVNIFERKLTRTNIWNLIYRLFFLHSFLVRELIHESTAATMTIPSTLKLIAFWSFSTIAIHCNFEPILYGRTFFLSAIFLSFWLHFHSDSLLGVYEWAALPVAHVSMHTFSYSIHFKKTFKKGEKFTIRGCPHFRPIARTDSWFEFRIWPAFSLLTKE